MNCIIVIMSCHRGGGRMCTYATFLSILGELSVSVLYHDHTGVQAWNEFEKPYRYLHLLENSPLTLVPLDTLSAAIGSHLIVVAAPQTARRSCVCCVRGPADSPGVVSLVKAYYSGIFASLIVFKVRRHCWRFFILVKVSCNWPSSRLRPLLSRLSPAHLASPRARLCKSRSLRRG